MVIDMFVVLAIFAVTLYLYFSKSNSSSTSLKRPPGPWSIPILGHLPLLGDQPARTLLQWKKKYGPIISVTLGSFPAVAINDATLIKAAFNLPAFAGRPKIKYLDDASRGRKGFMFGDGPHSQEQRQFIKRNLKDFGYGSRTMESIVLDQAAQLVQNLQQNVEHSKLLRVKHFINGYTVNSLWSIFSGKQLDPNDNETEELADAVTRAGAFPGILDKLMVFIPQVAVWFPSLSGYNDHMKCMDDIQKFVANQILEIKSARVPKQPRVVMDAYFDKVEETTDPQSGFYEKNNFVTISMQDLFAAGVETTSTTMEWTLYYMAKYPDVQRKLQNEIDKVIGQSRLPSANDKPQMKFTEAVTTEILRIATMLPFSLFHRSLEDVEFHGYHIPKNTMVLGNLYAAHNDPDVWGDPEVFRPERFLDNEGNLLKNENLIPFSWGKRNCIGENLARLQLFLFTVSIFQKFEVSAAGKLPSSLGDFGITVSPSAFDVAVKSRTVTEA